jgi:hypothetical protein
MRIESKKIYALFIFAILLVTAAANCAAQAAHAGQQASSTAKPDIQGCIDCTVGIPTLPQWCAIAMGLILIGLTLFLMRRSRAPVSSRLRRGAQ